MTTHTIYRVTCDAPHCPAVGIIEAITSVPEGWRRISSSDHLADWQPGQRRRLATGRTCTDKRSRWDVHAGSFSLHLCGDHTTTFDEHLPRTEGAAMGAGRPRRVLVACSCSGLSGSTEDTHWVGRDPMPNGQVERTWWQHLPAELQEYATRGWVEVAADR